MAAMKWGMICSVLDFSQEIQDKLKFFGEWLVNELELHSCSFHLLHYFMESPSFFVHCEPANKEAIYSAYEKIYREHPEVVYILHILPEKNSLEFRLMKDLTLNYALIGQGVLLDTALSHFENLDMEKVLENMNQYIMRRMSQLITFQRAENKYRFIIKDNKNSGGDTTINVLPAQHRINDIFVEKCVETILHSKDDDTCCAASVFGDSFDAFGGGDAAVLRDSSKTLIVEGFPVSFNKFQMASLFSHSIFRPVSVFITSRGRAFVEFTNKFHTIQAALCYIRDAIAIAANAEMDIHLRMRCADTATQKCFERRVASMANDKRNEMDASILASPIPSV